MRASFERLLGRPAEFPLEITLSSGDEHLLPHPDHAYIHPRTADLILYPDSGPFSIVINPDLSFHFVPDRMPVMNDAISKQSLRTDTKLRAMLTNPRAYPLEMTLVDGRKLLIASSKLIHFPPRMKNIVYFPPRKSDGLMEHISPDRVIKIRTLRKKRAA